MLRREIVIAWIDKAVEQDLHYKIYIPIENRDSGQKVVKQFKKELEILYQLEPHKSSTVSVAYSFRDRKHWVVLERVVGNPMIGFVRKPDGELERIQLNFDPDRDRRLSLMKKDGLSLKEAEEIEGPLSETEKKEFLK